MSRLGITSTTLNRKLANVEEEEEPELKNPYFNLYKKIRDFYLNGDIRKRLSFRENLVISFVPPSGKPLPVGGLCLDIQAPQEKTPNKPFLVHLSSKFDFKCHTGGSTITAWVGQNFETLEERRTEYVYENDVFNEKSLYICLHKNFNYYIKLNDDPESSLATIRNFVPEGSNFLLMRYLAISKFIGLFEIATIYIDGDICRNIYESNGPFGGMVNGTKLDLIKIYRTVIEPCTLEHKSTTILTIDGRIIKEEWENCDYFMHLNPICDLGMTPPDRIPLEKSWTSDMEMMAKFLDNKKIAGMNIVSYMQDFPQIKIMMGDYVRTILQLKPDDIIDFTQKYFKSFKNKKWPPFDDNKKNSDDEVDEIENQNVNHDLVAAEEEMQNE